MSLHSTEKKIMKELKKVWQDNRRENKSTPWTIAIKKALVALGHKLSYRGYASFWESSGKLADNTATILYNQTRSCVFSIANMIESDGDIVWGAP